MNMGQDRHMQMVGGNGGNQYNMLGIMLGIRMGIMQYRMSGIRLFRIWAFRMLEIRMGLLLFRGLLIRIQMGMEEAGIQLQAKEFDLMATAANLDEIEEVNANCILMASLQQASTSGTQTDKALVYDSDRSVEVHNYDDCYDNERFNMFTQEEQYTELLEPIPEPHQV
ncbi:hypothetical protein Tco_1536947 [Tanacetum coccineum]